jgi:hypothetical protein
MKFKASVIKIGLPLLIFLLLPAALIPACEFSFDLIGPDGATLPLRPGSETALQQGESYTLKVTFIEDHRKCLLTPEDTQFFLEEVKWKPGRDLPLVLEEAYAWEETDARTNMAALSFRAVGTGSVTLEIIRECDKGGYDELLLFSLGS